MKRDTWNETLRWGSGSHMLTWLKAGSIYTENFHCLNYCFPPLKRKDFSSNALFIASRSLSIGTFGNRWVLCRSTNSSLPLEKRSSHQGFYSWGSMIITKAHSYNDQLTSIFMSNQSNNHFNFAFIYQIHLCIHLYIHRSLHIRRHLDSQLRIHRYLGHSPSHSSSHPQSLTPTHSPAYGNLHSHLCTSACLDVHRHIATTFIDAFIFTVMQQLQQALKSQNKKITTSTMQRHTLSHTWQKSQKQLVHVALK